MRITRGIRPILLILPIVLSLGLLSGWAAPAQLLEGERTEVLSLEKAIAMALSNNLDVRISRSDLKADTQRINYAWGAFDPVLNLSGVRESNRTTQIISENLAVLQQSDVNRVFLSGTPATILQPTNRAFSDINFEDNVHLKSSLQVKTPLGTQWALNVTEDQISDKYRYGISQAFANSIFNPEYDAFAGVSITQPLLRDFGPAANMAEIRIARKTREITRLAWESKIDDAIQSVLTTYYEMQFGVAQLEVREQAIGIDQKFVRENQRKMELGMMSPIDVKQAEVALSTDQELLLEAKNFYMERQFQLKRQILAAFDAENDAVFLPMGTLSEKNVPLNRSQLLSEAFKNRLDYQQAVKQAEVQNIRLRYTRNQMYPRLDVIGSYGYNGLRNSWESAYSDAFRTKTPSWSIGIQASIPLGNVQGRSALAIAKTNKEQAILKIKQAELTASLEVETMISRIQTNLQTLETTRQTRRLAEEAVRIETKQIEQGLISVFDALENRKKLYDAQVREASALADLNKSYVLLDVATGTLLKKHSITVAE